MQRCFGCAFLLSSLSLCTSWPRPLAIRWPKILFLVAHLILVLHLSSAEKGKVTSNVESVIFFVRTIIVAGRPSSSTQPICLHSLLFSVSSMHCFHLDYDR